MAHDSTYEQDATPQQTGKVPPPEKELEGEKTETTSPWNPLGLLSTPVDLVARAAQAIPSHLPTVEVGEPDVPVQQARVAASANSVKMDFRPCGGAKRSPLVDKTIQKVKDSPDPVLEVFNRDANDIGRTLADLLKVQQSQDILSIHMHRAPSGVAGTEQFDMRVSSRSEKHMPLDQELSEGLPVKIDSVELGTDVSASLSYSRAAGIELSKINGVKVNVEAFGGFKQVVSPTKLTFGRDSAGKAVLGVQFVMHDAQGKAGEPINFAIPFSKVLEELGKRKK